MRYMSQIQAEGGEYASFIQLNTNEKAIDNFKLIIMAIFLALMLIFSLCAGDIWLTPAQWFSPEAELFVWNLRFPRVLSVIGVGAALALSGAVMQALFNNSLADPGLLGVSNGAGVAVVMALFLAGNGLHLGLLSGFAICGAMAITLLLILFSMKQGVNNTRLLLFGMAMGIGCSAFMTWAFYFSNNMDMRKIIAWTLGGFGGIDWSEAWLTLALIPAIGWLSCQGQTINIIALNELTAKQLGVNVKYWRILLVVFIGWLVGVSVALAGMIGFIGFVVPHLLRLWGITNHQRLLPGCVLAGASVLLASDTFARLALTSAEIPTGVVTATLGAPVFIWMLLRTPGGVVK
ncbi:vitamin B12 ABC transporter permease BtuC [Yokenella regensburgei]